MPTYKTPGVYVEEISTFPPSVPEVSTAVPAFIGYTEKSGEGLKNVPICIDTFLEFQITFGLPDTFGGQDSFRGAMPTAFTATASNGSVTVRKDAGQREWLMYYCLSMYFKNGGGSCYIISVGDYHATPGTADFEAGLKALEKEDEPTLILLTDAVNLPEADYYDLCRQVLALCGKLKDRFGIFDVLPDKVDEFRSEIGINDLKYGAAYYPYLWTTLNYAYTQASISVNGLDQGVGAAVPFHQTGANGIKVTYAGTESAPQVKILKGSGSDLEFEVEGDTLTIRNVGDGVAAADVVTAWSEWKSTTGNSPAGFDIAKAGEGTGQVTSPGTSAIDLTAPASAAATLSSIKDVHTQKHNQIKAELAKQRVVLPPSAAVAGIYAKVDRERGVWKAPANVSVASVIGPTLKITHDDQERLNIDPTAGKSINAIRSSVGKGTLVWGARTLAGNDNEWRYVNVRRLFNMIEKSTQKATAFAVFEANDATTWLKSIP